MNIFDRLFAKTTARVESMVEEAEGALAFQHGYTLRDVPLVSQSASFVRGYYKERAKYYV